MKIVSLKRYTKTNTNTLSNIVLLLCLWITTCHSTGPISKKKAEKKQQTDLASFAGKIITMPEAKKLFFSKREERKKVKKVSPQTVLGRKKTKQIPRRSTKKLKGRPLLIPPKKFISMLDHYIASEAKKTVEQHFN